MIILFIIMFVLLVLVVGYLNWFLFKTDKEVIEKVKRKTMVDTFLIIIAYLSFETLKAAYDVFIKDVKPEQINPFLFLSVIGILFFIFFKINKKKLTKK